MLMGIIKLKDVNTEWIKPKNYKNHKNSNDVKADQYLLSLLFHKHKHKQYEAVQIPGNNI